MPDYPVTRSSLLSLACDAGMKTEERGYSFEEWMADAASGRLKEVFACGTAAVITSISRVCHEDGDFTIGDGAMGPVARQLKQKLLGIQRGTLEDSYGWVHSINLP